MKKLFLLLLLLVTTFGGGTIFGRFSAMEQEPPGLFPHRSPTFVDRTTSPDPKVFAAVQNGLEKAHADQKMVWGKNWVLHTDSQNGVIESEWFEEHKGEVHFKVQIVVWGKHWHVDVWEWDGVPIWPGPVNKSEWSRFFERQLQSHIDDSVREQS